MDANTCSLCHCPDGRHNTGCEKLTRKHPRDLLGPHTRKYLSKEIRRDLKKAIEQRADHHRLVREYLARHYTWKQPDARWDIKSRENRFWAIRFAMRIASLTAALKELE